MAEMVWVIITVLAVLVLVAAVMVVRPVPASRARPEATHAAPSPPRSVKSVSVTAAAPPPHRQCPRCGRRQVEINGSGLRCGWCTATWSVEGDDWPDVTLCLWIEQGQASLEEKTR